MLRRSHFSITLIVGNLDESWVARSEEKGKEFVCRCLVEVHVA